MGYVLRMPQMGMSMEEGTVVEWMVDEGDMVEKGDDLVVVESEKVANEVDARESGALRRVFVEEGGVVEPGTPIGIVADPDEDLTAYERQLDGEVRHDGQNGRTATTDSSTKTQRTADATTRTGAEATSRAADVKVTPGATRRAEEAGIDLSTIEGSGPQGVIVEDDVEAALERRDLEPAARKTAAKPAWTGTETGETGGATRTVAETRELSNVQRTVCETLARSARKAVHVTLERSFDAEPLRALALETDTASLTDILIAAVSDALLAHPEFNAIYDDDEYRLIAEVNVGVAVDVADGLVTPVIPDVSNKSVEAIHSTRTERTERVQEGEFTMDDLSGGTFTISNLGPYGVDGFTPVINPPEVAILGVGRIDDGTMTLSLSFDHRVNNGADAAQFLETIVETLTDEGALRERFEVPPSVLETAEGASPDGPRTVRVETGDGYRGRYLTTDGDVSFDEPEAVGGTGSAPTPVDHLLGSLGSCLSLSIRAMAIRDDVALGTITGTVDGSPEDGPLSEITVSLELEGDVDDADEGTLEDLVTNAERACYVSRALSTDVSVSLEWTRV